MTVGLIGLGVMRRPMAGHLIKAGHRVGLASRSGVQSGMIDRDVISAISRRASASRPVGCAGACSDAGRSWLRQVLAERPPVVAANDFYPTR
ncbi:NAD(P)-binding domain-containing protein [Lichenicoccus sp.]|uniref:NAD(P)-binding domain-containing protein n=1 Tax=Lichenicoccus sp. TaxID=2781899 RepID=UPI003D117B44